MRISELVEKLNKIKDEEGDLSVYYEDEYGHIHPFKAVETVLYIEKQSVSVLVY